MRREERRKPWPGFGRGRGLHQTLDARILGMQQTRVGLIHDADVRSFFGNMSRKWTMKFPEYRVAMAACMVKLAT